MIKLCVTNEKNLELYELEKVHVGENKFGFYLIYLPEMLNGFALSECNVELVQVLADNTSVSINIDTTQQIRPIQKNITLDVTATAQTVTLSMLITHNGDIIGKTNQVTFEVHPTKNATPIDPREDLDEIIAEQRAEIAEQAETISEQATAIEAKDGQISELNGQVTELEAENAEQAQTITRQNTTIDELNTRRIPVYIEPNLESKEIVPKADTRYYAPSEGKDGFSSVTVDGATVEALGLNENYYKHGEPFLDKVGTYRPFPENSYGGIYFTELNENNVPVGIKVVNYDYNYNNFSVPALNTNTLQNNIKSFVLLDCKNVNIADNYFSGARLLTTCRLDGVLRIGNSAFQSCTSLTELTPPDSLTSIGYDAFNGCTSLTELTLPDSLTSIGQWAFQSCSSLTELTLPDSLTSIGDSAFRNCTSLTNLTLAQGFNCNGLNVSSSTRFTAETIVACLEALADRTGQTAYTITFGTTNLNKLTAEQKAIAINKNWNLA